MMHSVVAELQPIIDAIDASLRDGWRFADRDVSIALPAGEGRSLIVSVRPAGTRAKAHAAPGRGLDERQLRLVESAIHERIAEPISVSALSSVAGLSRSHFSNAFRTSVGRTPHAYVVRLRLERAMKLMGETDTALSEIALATGFADQAHFSNAFRRAVGMTPTQWRKSNARACNQSPHELDTIESPIFFRRTQCMNANISAANSWALPS